MDKRPVYPGAIPTDTDLLTPQRNMEIALGFLLQAAFGTTTVIDGLAVTQQASPNMTVKVGQGSIIFLTTVDTLTSGFGSLALDNANPLVKIGVNLTPTNMSALTAPVTAGQSQNWLVEAQFIEADGSPLVLQYYNAANPAVPYTGPSNTGTTNNTARTNRVQLQWKAGTAATTGTQTTPAPDAGWVGVAVVTVANGQATIVNANITAYLPSPIIPAKLGAGMVPGFANMQSFKTTANFTVPAGITKIFAYAVGGGGASGGVGSGTAASGGASGGTYGEGVYTVTPGQVITVTVGAAGAAGAGAGGNGGATSVGALLSCPGGLGSPGIASGQGAAAASPAAATGAALSIVGFAGAGGGNIGGTLIAGAGGGTFLGQGGYSNTAAQALGSGGGGSAVVSSSANGLAGAAGLAVIRW